MSRRSRLTAAVLAEYRSFVRRRTALFFTLVFPVLIVFVFAAAIRAGDGAFLGADAAYFVPGYIALVIVFAPLSRVAGSVPRDRETGRFEKLSTTPLRPWEWLASRAIVAGGLATGPVIAVVLLAVWLTPATIVPSPWIVPLAAAIVVTFAGIGAIIGRVADSEDGAIAIGNAIGFPIVFFSDTLMPPAVLPSIALPLLELSPVTHFARATRAVLGGHSPGTLELFIVIVVGVAVFAIGVRSLPRMRS